MVVGLQNNEGEFHKSCFNAALLRGDLTNVGFEIKVLKLVWTHNQESLQAICVKPEFKKELIDKISEPLKTDISGTPTII
jgi:hypothetical protein